MSDGVASYEPEVAAYYEERRWWLGLTMGDLLDRAADTYPEREALVGESPVTGAERLTWKELRGRSDTMAFRLVEEGFKPGDRVLLQLANWPEFVVSYFALQKAGIIPVLLAVTHTAREIQHLAALTEPKGWIVPSWHRKDDQGPLIADVLNSTLSLEHVFVLGDSVPATHGYGELLHTDVSGEEISTTLADTRPNPRSVCQILPSGGTTGLPKGAPRTHNDYIVNVEYKSKAWDLNVTDTTLVATPVGHNLALLVTVTGSVFHGAKMVMLDSTRPEDMCRIIEDERVTALGMVPTLISRLVAYEDLERYDVSSVNKAYVGAANSPPELVRSAEQRLGCRYTNAFGMVEGPCSQSRPEDPEHVRRETIGRPVCPYDEFVTLDEEGRPTPTGVEGELAARGPGIFAGYYRNPEANEKVFTPDGFFRTGDLATVSKEGRIRITGRLKDIIIRGGENIAARDVEDLISSHPDVEYVACVGLEDADLGEVVCAVIKPRSSSITHEDIVSHLQSLQAAKSFIPARTEFMAEIPLTAAGKADKKQLKKDLQGENS